MQIITVTNQKGGVGKSTSALSLGAGLSLLGYKVLFIDLDSQANLSYTLGINSYNANSMNILISPDTILQQIQHTPYGDIIPSSPSLSGADSILTDIGKEYRLNEALQKINNLYDFVFIDTPPALGILTVNALAACQGAIIPAGADIYSLQGINQLSNTINTVKKYCNPKLKILGILLTRFNPRAIISREVADTLLVTAQQISTKLYNTKIRECTAIKEAQAMKQSIFNYAPKSNAAKDYQSVIEQFLKEDVK